MKYELTCTGVSMNGTSITAHPYKSEERASFGRENRCPACSKAYRAAVIEHYLFARCTQRLPCEFVM